MSNQLKFQTSPYLLQHAENPVDWYPWCEEAFQKAEQEDKPIFLSIGYSTCHWCHVMAHESFEDEEIANLLNENFVSIKVDKEERPDIDSIYMSVCQAFTGSGGWPTSIFMTADQKPFYAGTYFPKNAGYGRIGFADLLQMIREKWTNERFHLLQSADDITNHLKTNQPQTGTIEENLLHSAVSQLKQSYDPENGGFGMAPKFPTPHNLLFLMDYATCYCENDTLDIAEHTLQQLYKGGIFDHIGFGFSRYSTDPYFRIPHFEKMLYDNALLIMSYASAFYATKHPIYKEIACKVATYVLRELVSPNGGFYSAQDADSEGVEGKYYAFTEEELIQLLGESEGTAFNAYYGITKEGNFEGKNIPNLLHHTDFEDRFASVLPTIYAYRKTRTSLHLDDKILTSWNALMISALCLLYRVSDDKTYLGAAETAYRFIEENLCQRDTLYVSYRNGQRSGKGFLDDYAFVILALINLYDATLQQSYLAQAITLCHKVMADFWDEPSGGFFMYGAENEALIVKPKVTYDGAIPSGNSVMAYNLVRLSQLTNEGDMKQYATKQLAFLSSSAEDYPAGYCFFLLALSAHQNPYDSIVCVRKAGDDTNLPTKNPALRTTIRVLDAPTEDYPLWNDKTTFYVCKNHSCLPPTNDLMQLLK